MGAEVHVCPTAVAPDHPDSYYSVAEKLHNEIPNSVWCNQYDNLPIGRRITVQPGLRFGSKRKAKSPISLSAWARVVRSAAPPST